MNACCFQMEQIHFRTWSTNYGHNQLVPDFNNNRLQRIYCGYNLTPAHTQSFDVLLNWIRCETIKKKEHNWFVWFFIQSNAVLYQQYSIRVFLGWTTKRCRNSFEKSQYAFCFHRAGHWNIFQPIKISCGAVVYELMLNDFQIDCFCFERCGH